MTFAERGAKTHPMHENVEAVFARLTELGWFKYVDPSKVDDVRGRFRDEYVVAPSNLAEGDVFFGVCLTRQIRDRGASELIGENRALLEHARGLGGSSYFGGTLPQNESEWRRALGDRFETVMRTKRLADPAGVLGALFW